jgi:hypothetical protein
MALEIGSDAAEAWRTIKSNAKQQRINLPIFHAALAAGDVTIEYVFEVYRQIRNSRNQLETLKATSGLNQYVQTIRNDPVYDATAAVTAVTDAQLAALNWIDSNASGISLTGDSAENALVNNSVASNRFTAVQTSDLRALLVAINDEIAG